MVEVVVEVWIVVVAGVVVRGAVVVDVVDEVEVGIGAGVVVGINNLQKGDKMARDAELETKVLALPGGKEFKDSVDSLNLVEIRSRITDLQVGLKASEETMAADEELQALKAKLTEMKAPYLDVRKAVKIKTKYLLKLMEEK